MELKHETPAFIGGMPAATFELARAAGLSVCDNTQSTFNRQVSNFAAAIAAPLQAEIDALRLEVAELRQVRASIEPPKCPQGCIEYEYGAGVTRGAKEPTLLVCHLEYSPALPATETDPAESASVELIAAYHRGVDVLDTLVSDGHAICIEQLALEDAQR